MEEFSGPLVSLAGPGRVADGWLPLWMSPDESPWYEAQIQAGIDAPAGLPSLEDLDAPDLPPAREPEAAAGLEYKQISGGMLVQTRDDHKLNPAELNVVTTRKPTDEEIRASSLQFVRKLSGFAKPSKANEEPFNRAVEGVTQVAKELLHSLTTQAPRRDREVEADPPSRLAPRELDRVLLPDGEAGRVGRQLRRAHRIVELVDVAQVRLRPRDFGDLGFERQHLVRSRGGVRR